MSTMATERDHASTVTLEHNGEGNYASTSDFTFADQDPGLTLPPSDLSCNISGSDVADFGPLAPELCQEGTLEELVSDPESWVNSLSIEDILSVGLPRYDQKYDQHPALGQGSRPSPGDESVSCTASYDNSAKQYQPSATYTPSQEPSTDSQILEHFSDSRHGTSIATSSTSEDADRDSDSRSEPHTTDHDSSPIHCPPISNSNLRISGFERRDLSRRSLLNVGRRIGAFDIKPRSHARTSQAFSPKETSDSVHKVNKQRCPQVTSTFQEHSLSDLPIPIAIAITLGEDEIRPAILETFYRIRCALTHEHHATDEPFQIQEIPAQISSILDNILQKFSKDASFRESLLAFIMQRLYKAGKSSDSSSSARSSADLSSIIETKIEHLLPRGNSLQMDIVKVEKALSALKTQNAAEGCQKVLEDGIDALKHNSSHIKEFIAGLPHMRSLEAKVVAQSKQIKDLVQMCQELDAQRQYYKYAAQAVKEKEKTSAPKPKRPKRRPNAQVQNVTDTPVQSTAQQPSSDSSRLLPVITRNPSQNQAAEWTVPGQINTGGMDERHSEHERFSTILQPLAYSSTLSATSKQFATHMAQAAAQMATSTHEQHKKFRPKSQIAPVNQSPLHPTINGYWVPVGASHLLTLPSFQMLPGIQTVLYPLPSEVIAFPNTSVPNAPGGAVGISKHPQNQVDPKLAQNWMTRAHFSKTGSESNVSPVVVPSDAYPVNTIHDMAPGIGQIVTSSLVPANTNNSSSPSSRKRSTPDVNDIDASNTSAAKKQKKCWSPPSPPRKQSYGPISKSTADTLRHALNNPVLPWLKLGRSAESPIAIDSEDEDATAVDKPLTATKSPEVREKSDHAMRDESEQLAEDLEAELMAEMETLEAIKVPSQKQVPPPGINEGTRAQDGGQGLNGATGDKWEELGVQLEIGGIDSSLEAELFGLEE